MQKHNVPHIEDRGDLKGVYVFVRASLNVPVQDGKVTNTFRITQSLQTVEYLRTQGARIILCSHMGRGKEETLHPVFEVLKKDLPITFSPEVTGATTTALRDALQDGEVLLLENVRSDEREVNNDEAFARELALLADMYVNDDFAASHRSHASLDAICSFLPSYAGIHFMKEYTELIKVMEPESPSLFILGGAKFETKMPLIEKYLRVYDHVFIGGALANDLFKARGYEVGTSLVSDVSLTGSELVNHPKILIPSDVTVEGSNGTRITNASDVATHESIKDIGPQTIADIAPYIASAKTILWNGPMGNYEQGFQEQTQACAQHIAQSDAYTVVGGGDTVASIETLGLNDHFDFLSTAGGAMLTFLEAGTLPGLEALERARS